MKEGVHNLFQLLSKSRWWLMTSWDAHIKSQPIKQTWKLSLNHFGQHLCNYSKIAHRLIPSDWYHQQIDHLYHDRNIKVTEGSQQEESPGILVRMILTDQPPPFEMENFWPVSENKVSFQQFSLNGSRQNYCNDKTLYLGRSHQEDENIYLLVSNAEKESQKEPLLRCTHEENDDRIMFHLSQIITDAEIFLVKCISSNCSIEFFD